MWDDEIDPMTGLVMIRAYMRRKHWEARMIAYEVLSGMSGDQPDQEPVAQAPRRPRQTMGSDGKIYTWQDDPLNFLATAQGLK